MKSIICLTMICATSFLAGCGQDRVDGALFRDVARHPPLTREQTVEYLVLNDRPMAEWTEEMARACDDHGCPQ